RPRQSQCPSACPSQWPWSPPPSRAAALSGAVRTRPVVARATAVVTASLRKLFKVNIIYVLHHLRRDTTTPRCRMCCCPIPAKRRAATGTIAAPDRLRKVSRGVSESEAAQTGVVVSPPAQGPAKLPVFLADGQIVDGRMTSRHQALRIELPVLVAEGPKPVSGVVMPSVRETDGDATALEGPQLLDQS